MIDGQDVVVGERSSFVGLTGKWYWVLLFRALLWCRLLPPLWVRRRCVSQDNGVYTITSIGSATDKWSVEREDGDA